MLLYCSFWIAKFCKFQFEMICSHHLWLTPVSANEQYKVQGCGIWKCKPASVISSVEYGVFWSPMVESWFVAWNGDIGLQGWQSGHSLHSQAWRGSPSCKFTWASPLYLISTLAYCVILQRPSLHGHNSWWVLDNVFSFISICMWISLTFSTFLLQPPSVAPLPTPIKETTNAAA